MDIQDYQSQECNVIEEYQSENNMAIMTTNEMNRTGSNNPVLFTGTYDQCLAYINHNAFPIQDDTWPSRKWNTNKTDYIDLSGE